MPKIYVYHDQVKDLEPDTWFRWAKRAPGVAVISYELMPKNETQAALYLGSLELLVATDATENHSNEPFSGKVILGFLEILSSLPPPQTTIRQGISIFGSYFLFTRDLFKKY